MRYPAPPAGSRAVGVRGIRAIRSLQSRLMYHDLTPCHVAHVGRRVANTGRAPVGRGDTAGGVTVYSPPHTLLFFACGDTAGGARGPLVRNGPSIARRCTNRSIPTLAIMP